MTVLTTLAPTVDATGISAPVYPDIFDTLVAQYQGIFGSDAVVDPDSQDGQMLAIFATAVNDLNSTVVKVFGGFSPTYAEGAGLSSVVKLNGLTKEVGTYSTADLTITGVTGANIINGVVGDDNQNQWFLPATVVIPGSGSIIETAICGTPGNITAAPNAIDEILTPTLGWQTATNVGAATVGVAVETDAQLRERQAVSTSIPAESVLDAIIGLVANLPGVGATNVRGYENDGGTPDGNGVPGHSISLVVNGGDSVQIATTIAKTKCPGTGTYGTTSELIIDQKGVPNTINFYRPTQQRVIATVNLHALTGYVSTTGTAVLAALAAFVGTVGLGNNVPWFEAVGACNLGVPLNATYSISSVTLGLYGGGQSQADVSILFNGLAGLAVTDIVLNLV